MTKRWLGMWISVVSVRVSVKVKSRQAYYIPRSKVFSRLNIDARCRHARRGGGDGYSGCANIVGISTEPLHAGWRQGSWGPQGRFVDSSDETLSSVDAQLFDKVTRSQESFSATGGGGWRDTA